MTVGAWRNLGVVLVLVLASAMVFGCGGASDVPSDETLAMYAETARDVVLALDASLADDATAGNEALSLWLASRAEGLPATLPDGSNVEVDAEGNVTITRPDGMVIELDAQGNGEINGPLCGPATVEPQPDGSILITRPDGSTLVVTPGEGEGSLGIPCPQGLAVVEPQPDGSLIITTPSGTVIRVWRSPQGGVQVSTASGVVVVVTPGVTGQETVVITLPDGTVLPMVRRREGDCEGCELRIQHHWRVRVRFNGDGSLEITRPNGSTFTVPQGQGGA